MAEQWPPSAADNEIEILAAGDLKRTEFAKWLFTSAAVVGSLGAAFSNPAIGGLTGRGRYLFLFAVALVGISLGLATVALTLELEQKESLTKAMRDYGHRRASWLKWAGWLFAFAIGLAALAPLVS